MLASASQTVLSGSVHAARRAHAAALDGVKAYCPSVTTGVLTSTSSALNWTADGVRAINKLAADSARLNAFPGAVFVASSARAPLVWVAGVSDKASASLLPASALADPFCGALSRAVAWPPALLPASAVPASLWGGAEFARIPPAQAAAVVLAAGLALLFGLRLLRGLLYAFGLARAPGAGRSGARASSSGVGARPHGRDREVYLVDVATVQTFDPRCAVSQAEWFPHIQKYFGTRDEEVAFDKKILERSGIGSVTHLPLSILSKPPNINLQTAREESETVMFDVVRQLLERTRVRAQDVDFLVVNCSLFNPTPSHAAMIINHFKMRSDIVSYSLAGMGCSASVLACDLASDLLAMSSKPNPIAIVVSFENLTQNLYFGQEKQMHLANVLFRMGGAAVMLTRTPKAAPRGRHPAARWRLNTLVRVHIGADDAAYRCVYQDIDSEKNVGVSLSKDVPRVATRALAINMGLLGLRVLPLTAKLGYAVREAVRRVRARLFRITGGSAEDEKKRFPPTVPNFRSAVDYVCIHAGGRAVIDGIQQTLGLRDADVEASRAVLHKYGNTSSSSIWYEFQHVEKNNRVSRGQKVWQIAFGSGFKCNSAIWERL